MPETSTTETTTNPGLSSNHYTNKDCMCGNSPDKTDNALSLDKPSSNESLTERSECSTTSIGTKIFAQLNFLRDKDRIDPNSMSLTRSTAFFVSLALTFAFVYNAYRGTMNDLSYITYPLGVAFCFAPAFFNKVSEKILNLRR